jgi:hypothetical protein
MSKLKACPFCGFVIEDDSYYDDFDQQWLCECGACGPARRSKSAATRAWNNRVEVKHGKAKVS